MIVCLFDKRLYHWIICEFVSRIDKILVIKIPSKREPIKIPLWKNFEKNNKCKLFIFFFIYSIYNFLKKFIIYYFLY